MALCALALTVPARIGQAAAAGGPVALVVNTDVPAFSWVRLQRVVADAVGVPVIATDDPGAGERRGLLTISWRPTRRELAVTYESARGSISRIVPSSDDIEDAVNAATILAVNLVRDQAAEFLTSPPPEPPRRVEAPAPVAVVHPEPPVPPRFLFSLLGGTGLGWASGAGEVHVEEYQSGLAWARAAHLSPELGLFVAPRVLMSVQARLQFVSGATDVRITDPVACGGDFVCSAPRSAAAAFVKATLFGGPTAGDFRPYVSLAVGAGAIRHVMRSHGSPVCGPTASETCFDTTNGGPLLAGPGVGLQYRVAGRFSVVAGLEIRVGAPHFTLNTDANVGAAVGF